MKKIISIILIGISYLIFLRNATAGHYSDPDPKIDISDSQISMIKELSGYLNYGVIDGKADVLYSGEENNWWFKLPPDLSYTNVQVTLSLVFDDHYHIEKSEYCAKILVNGNELFSGSLASLEIEHGEPYGERFTNWQPVSFPLQISSYEMEVSVVNCSNLAVEEWIAIDNIILEAYYQIPPLEVDLLSFAAKATANGTTVKWTTANEQDIIAFNLYKGIPQIGADCTSHNPNDYHLVNLSTVNSGKNAYQFDDHFTAVANTTYCYGLVSLNDRGDIVDILGVIPRQ